MNNPGRSFLGPIFMGLGATLTLDLLALFLLYAFKIRPSSFCLVGRWLRYMPEGIFRHSNLGSAAPKSAECVLGWIAHYLIGIAFAIVFIDLAGPGWLQRPTPIPAILFGIVTVAAPFFVMQPAFGLGVAGSRAPDPTQARLRSLMNHTVFGLGLYLSGWLLSHLG